MNILITCNTLTYCSGSPLYNYTLAIELAKEHTVTIISRFSYWVEQDCGKEIMRKTLETAGVRCLDFFLTPTVKHDHYDLSIVSQNDFIQQVFDLKPTKILQVIHSEYDCEKPTIDNRIYKYIAIRPSIKDHLMAEYEIPSKDIAVIFNGVDRERFAPRTTQVDYKSRKIVVPCTIDPLREKFLNYIISEASLNPSDKIEIYGKDCGAKLDPLPPNVTIHPPMFNIEDAMRDAFMVSGILLGRVNLEARSMGIVNTIHDPEDPESHYYFYPNEEEFDKKHNIKSVTKEILSC